MAVSPAKREESGTLMEFAEHQKHFALVALAACGEHLSLRVCSAPANRVTPLCGENECCLSNKMAHGHSCNNG
jgi:hypothetical protein